ncbi:MAG TPA: presqualene diphosphate synthase HpnD [Vicinamibacterales bacterium]|nr:presqualene diphosphate synthase HpnD [Vicinamibacterales bacterium]
MSRDTSFAYSFLVLPRDRREAIGAVWDFCRAVDDVVDEPSDDAPAAALASWREELARCYEGEPRTPQGRALEPWIRRFGLPRRSFEDLLDGVEMDLTRTRYATFEDLYEYCWRVAGAVGLMCLPIFGCRHPGSRDYAMHLGVALQLTNIVRDVRTDLARGRIYLPQADLSRFGCSEADLAAPGPGESVRRLLAFECARAREYFARARAALPSVDAPKLVAAEIMGRIYEDILARVEASGYDVFGGRVRVPRPRRAWIALRVWLRSLAGFRAGA